MSNDVGIRHDEGKTDMSLLCPISLTGTSRILTKGAVKYARHNWTKGMLWSRVIASLLRHLFKFMAGEDIDEESGEPHVDHIACNAMFLQNYYRQHKSFDDRLKTVSNNEPKTKE